MQTAHRVLIDDARRLTGLGDGSVHLIVTSPPYPMIEMWDGTFAELAPESALALAAGQGFVAFEAMHRALDEAWAQCARVLAPGGLLCVNVGDATRSLGGEFALYPNHARIIGALLRLGLTPLPDILWRKPTNAPNKFMGSGMLPAGAYVTYEHEYVLNFRKGGKRVFSAADRRRRAASAYFWEERNLWFSDVWTDLRGAGQGLGEDGPRARSAAFPFELPYRLIQMYAMQGDTVLDPFAGTGVTAMAALASGRNSVSVERVEALKPVILDRLRAGVAAGQRRVTERLAAHRAFVAHREAAGKSTAHTNAAYGFTVITRQEAELVLMAPASAELGEDGILRATYSGPAQAPPQGPSLPER